MHHIGTESLYTPRLLLRRYTMEDLEALYRNLLSDPQVMRNLDWQGGTDRHAAARQLTLWLRLYRHNTCYHWAICLHDEVVGDIAVTRWNATDQRCALGFGLARHLWGQGLMTEALTTILRYLFDRVAFHRVEAIHTGNNPASGRVMAKAGLLPEGRLASALRSGDGFEDLVLYGVTRDRWLAQQKP